MNHWHLGTARTASDTQLRLQRSAFRRLCTTILRFLVTYQKAFLFINGFSYSSLLARLYQDVGSTATEKMDNAHMVIFPTLHDFIIFKVGWSFY